VRREQIEAELRAKLARGQFPPGGPLPSRNALVQQYGTSKETVQLIMRALEADGFIVSRGRAGTIVNPDPPFRKRYALLFPHKPGDPMHWTLFSEGIRQQAETFGAGDDGVIAPYYDMELGVSADYRRLVEDITHYRLAGLIYSVLYAPHELLPLARTHGLPAVALASDAQYGFMGGAHGESELATHVVFSHRSFFRAALGRLVAAGRRRPALLMTPGMMPFMETNVLREAARLGLDVRPHRVQYAPAEQPVMARNIVHAIMLRENAGAPDALVVADDNLLPHALLGLQDAGVRIGEDADVIAHANFPLPTAELNSPVVRIGFDLRAALEQTVRLARQWRETGHRPGPVAVRAEEGGGKVSGVGSPASAIEATAGKQVSGAEAASLNLSP
jgi:DNA-binding LacI/PurR family transcriptional regulator